jgi:hypothetical protein
MASGFLSGFTTAFFSTTASAHSFLFSGRKILAGAAFSFILMPLLSQCTDEKDHLLKNKDCLHMNFVPFPWTIKTISLLIFAAALKRNGPLFIYRIAPIILSFAVVEPSETGFVKPLSIFRNRLIID